MSGLSNVTPIVQSKLLNCTINRMPGYVLSNNGYVYAACAVRVATFSTGGKFQFELVSNFTELHTLTLATRSYVLLL